MVSITRIFTTALNLVENLVAALDGLVWDSCGNAAATQTSCELLDFEDFLLLVFCKLMGRLTLFHPCSS